MPLNIRLPQHPPGYTKYINRSFVSPLGVQLTQPTGKIMYPVHGLMRRAAGPVISLPYKLIDGITEVFERQILARRSKAVEQNAKYVLAAKTKLSANASIALKSLEKQGYWVGKLEDFSVDNELLASLNKCLANHYSSMGSFLQETSYTKAALQQSELDEKNNWPLYIFGLEEELLNLATSYIQLPVAYIGTQLKLRVHDPKTPEDGLPHRDGEEGSFKGERPRMLKMFYLPNGLTQDQAPVTLTGGQKRIQLYGAPGTFIIVDTAKHEHCLIPMLKSPILDRFVHIFAYSSANPIAPHTCSSPTPSNKSLQQMNHAYHWSDLQKNAALWRGDMPYGKSLIPIKHRIPFTRYILPWIQSV